MKRFAHPREAKVGQAVYWWPKSYTIFRLFKERLHMGVIVPLPDIAYQYRDTRVAVQFPDSLNCTLCTLDSIVYFEA